MISKKQFIQLLTALTLTLLVTATSKAQSTNNAPKSPPLEQTLTNIDQYLNGLTRDNKFNGSLLIIKDGKKIFSKGYGWADKENNIPFTTSTFASLGSVTKAFTAAAVMKLVDLKKLTTENKLKDYFPTVPKDKENITIHQLLTHSSGFPELRNGPDGDYEKISKDQYLAKAFSSKLLFIPGEKGIYSNANFSLLAMIIETVSQMDYESFIKKTLFLPVGMKHTGFQYPQDKDVVIAKAYQDGESWGTHQSHFAQVGGGPFWNLKGNGGLEISLDEMYLWVTALNGYKVLSKSSLERMYKPYITEEQTHQDFGYGCNLNLTGSNTKFISNGGSNGFYFARMNQLPSEGLFTYLVTTESSINSNMVMPSIMLLLAGGDKEQAHVEQKGKFDSRQAPIIYKILIEKGPDNFEKEMSASGELIQDDMILLEVGEAFTKENKIDEAMALYKYYTNQFPQIAVSWNELGDLYLQKGNKEEAIKCYRNALEAKPGNQRAQESLKKLQ